MEKNWQEIWNKKELDTNISEKKLFQKMIYAVGFKDKINHCSVKAWEKFENFVMTTCQMKPQDTIFEVGCGCGAFLYNRYRKGHIVSGIDFSNTLIQAARKIMPNMEFILDEAINLDINKKFDILVSNSIFFYFPDLKYAKEVITKMINKSKRAIAILDLPDKKLKDICERQREIKIEDYKNRYKKLKHLYFSKRFFLEIAEENNLDILLFKQNIEGYFNSKFRFNCFMLKR